MRSPGFYDDVPEPEYHADRDSLSVSGAKLLLKAPARFRWQMDNGQAPRRHFDVGHAAHSLILGVGDPLYVTPFDNWRTKQAGLEQDIARTEGMVPLLPADYEAACDMADAISAHETAMRLLSEGRPEVSAYALDERTDVMRRARFDWLGVGVLSDIKTTRCAEPWAFAGDVAKYGYHQQAAWYLDLARDLGHPAEAFAFIVVEKEPPYLVEVYDLDAAAVERGRELNRRALERFRDCTASGLWPGYTARPFTTLSLPKWAHYDNDYEETA